MEQLPAPFANRCENACIDAANIPARRAGLGSIPGHQRDAPRTGVKDNMNQQHFPHPPVSSADVHAHMPDEIDLVDLAVVLVRRWRLMLAIFVLVVVLGTAAAWLKGTNYEYSAVVEIGQTIINSDKGVERVPLDSPEAVQALITSAIVPAAALEASDDVVAELAKDIRVEAVKGSSTVIVKVVALEARAVQVDQLFGQIRQRLLAEHTRHFDRLVQPLQAQASAREVELAALAYQISELESGLSDASSQARVALTDRLRRLQEAQQAAKAELARHHTDLSRITPTRMSEVPQRSLEQKGTSAKLIVALAAVLGAMLAVFAAFFAEFASRVRARLQA